MDTNTPTVELEKKPEVLKTPVKTKKTKKEKFKNFLLTFFIIEHFVVLLILLIPVVFLVRAYAYSDFGVLNEKAENFVPQNTSDITVKYLDKYENYLNDFVRSGDSVPVFPFELEESDVNSELASLDLDQIEKVYVAFEDNNIIYIWFKPKSISYPIMAKTTFVYNYDTQVFEVEILDWQIGPLSFPASILGFLEESINEDLWGNISQFFENSSFHISHMSTAKENLSLEIQIDDKQKFLTSLFDGGFLN